MELTKKAVNDVRKFERSVMLFDAQLVRFVYKHFSNLIEPANEKKEKELRRKHSERFSKIPGNEIPVWRDPAPVYPGESTGPNTE